MSRLRAIDVDPADLDLIDQQANAERDYWDDARDAAGNGDYSLHVKEVTTMIMANMNDSTPQERCEALTRIIKEHIFPEPDFPSDEADCCGRIAAELVESWLTEKDAEIERLRDQLDRLRLYRARVEGFASGETQP